MIGQNRFTLVSDAFGVHRAVKMNLANEGLEAKKKEDEVLAKKRKAEEDASWEGLSLRIPFTAGNTNLSIFTTANREQRVGSWRTFSKDSKKKKKQKVNILG